MLPQTPEIAGRSNIAKTTNMRAGNRRVQLAKRAANAAASTAPKRKALHMPANTAARSQYVSHELDAI